MKPRQGLPKPPPAPCGSCPYRRDVPSGIWHPTEYEKLPLYDGKTWQQSPALFLCHQRDSHLCGGWLACHDPRELLALRIAEVDPAAYSYRTTVPVFATGREACDHGVKDIAQPSPLARKMLAGLARKRVVS